MKQFPRKHSHKLFLFGYQAIGGSEFPINEQSPDLCHSLREQANPESHFNKRNIRHLLIDGKGTFDSGPVDLDAGQICLVSGIFYHELDKDNATVEEMDAYFEQVRSKSELVGKYSVLRGIKEQKVALPTEEL